jgi:hypothetical protein
MNVFDYRQNAWDEDIQPIVERLLAMGQEHGIGIAVTGIVTDMDDLDGPVGVRGGIGCDSPWYFEMFPNALREIIRGSISDFADKLSKEEMLYLLQGMIERFGDDSD